VNNPKNMPPKAPKLPGNPTQNNPPAANINYKLPPRPGTRQGNDNAKVNQSYEYNRNSSREKSVERLNTDRDKSKENLQRAA